MSSGGLRGTRQPNISRETKSTGANGVKCLDIEGRAARDETAEHIPRDQIHTRERGQGKSIFPVS